MLTTTINLTESDKYLNPHYFTNPAELDKYLDEIFWEKRRRFHRTLDVQINQSS